MGHKVHPKAFRLAVTHNWDARWFSKDTLPALLREDVQIREFLLKTLKDALVDRVEIERTRQVVTLTIYSAKPGVVIGRAGAGIEQIRKQILQRFYRGRKVSIQVNVKEIQYPVLSAAIVGQQIAVDIEKRLPFRRSMKQTIEKVMKGGAQGVKVILGGRLNGAEIARTEMIAQGKIPLHNLRADIDFARVRAETIYGTIGIKVWINRGEIFEKVSAPETETN